MFVCCIWIVLDNSHHLPPCLSYTCSFTVSFWPTPLGTWNNVASMKQQSQHMDSEPPRLDFLNIINFDAWIPTSWSCFCCKWSVKCCVKSRAFRASASIKEASHVWWMVEVPHHAMHYGYGLIYSRGYLLFIYGLFNGLWKPLFWRSNCMFPSTNSGREMVYQMNNGKKWYAK